MCRIKTVKNQSVRERGRLQGKGSGEKVSFKTRMEDPVRHWLNGCLVQQNKFCCHIESICRMTFDAVFEQKCTFCGKSTR